jgi:hypothetical protein
VGTSGRRRMNREDERWWIWSMYFKHLYGNRTMICVEIILRR